MSDLTKKSRELLERESEEGFILVEVKDNEDLEFLKWVNSLCDHLRAALPVVEAADMVKHNFPDSPLTEALDHYKASVSEEATDDQG